MVWFQCEDCGENLKKPKLAAHFPQCSATKLSCIDCGVIFNQQSVQAHTQCVSEAEKYGPKNNVNISSVKTKFTETGSNSMESCLGLSTSAPWNCSLCNVKATSQESLALHAQGKKHKSKVKAATVKQLDMGRNDTSQKTVGKNSVDSLQSPLLPEDKSCTSKVPSIWLEGQGINEERELGAANTEYNGLATELCVNHKRKQSEDEPNYMKNGCQLSLGQETNTGPSKEQDYKKRRKMPAGNSSNTEGLLERSAYTLYENSQGSQKIKEGNGFSLDLPSFAETPCSISSLSMAVKWKKIIKKTLKKSDGQCLRRKDLFKSILPVILNKLESAGISASKDNLRYEFENQICSSSMFLVDGKVVRLSGISKADG